LCSSAIIELVVDRTYYWRQQPLNMVPGVAERYWTGVNGLAAGACYSVYSFYSLRRLANQAMARRALGGKTGPLLAWLTNDARGRRGWAVVSALLAAWRVALGWRQTDGTLLLVVRHGANGAARCVLLNRRQAWRQVF
jgi:hypothetical protein